MKALVFGGAFNPPTVAHIELAEYAMKASGAETVIFVPSKMRYIEEDQGKDFAFTDEERLDMLGKIAAERPWMRVSDYEILSPEQPRTYRTMCHLKDEGYECRLLFGSDKLPELRNGWRFVDELMHEFGIVCMERYEDDCHEMIAEDAYLRKYADCIEVIETPEEYHSVSSTEVRRAFLEGDTQTLNRTVPEELNGLSEYRKRRDRI